MTVASVFGRNLRATPHQRPLNDMEAQTWASLQSIEGLPDGGYEQVESSELSKMHAFSVAQELFRTHLPQWRVSLIVSAWIACHSQGRLKYVTMWAAIVASITDDINRVAGAQDVGSERWGEIAMRRTVKVQHLAKFMDHKIPNDDYFERVWADTELANGKFELDLNRSWR